VTSQESREHVTAYIALGSNLGDRHAMIQRALDALRSHAEIAVIKVSDIIETEPVGPPEQSRYLNAAAELRTSLSPRGLLEACLKIERDLGRDRTLAARWGPRVIDIDLLLYSDLQMDESGLKIPHPAMHEREFVLVPLAQIAPTVLHPVMGVTIESLRCRQVSTSAAGI
jgi:2-amino-4-hydroxy-6-hydroxymethyldihydropteridine diphosphokinase